MSTIDPAILFSGEPGCPGGCCDCCGDYCPSWDSEPGRAWDVPLMRGVFDGIEYAGNRYYLIRRDRLGNFPANQTLIEILSTPDWATVPEVVPPALPSPRSTALYLDRLARAGLEARTHRDHYTHLYLDAEHVGWGTTTKTDAGITIDDLPLVRDIAHKAGISINSAAAALHVARAAS